MSASRKDDCRKKYLVFLFSWKSPGGLPGSLKDQGYRQTSFSLLGDCPAAGQADSRCRSEALPSGATVPDAPPGYVSKELRRKNIRKPAHGSLNNICLSRNVTAPPHPSVTPKETQVLQMRPCGDTAYGSSSGDPGLRGGSFKAKKSLFLRVALLKVLSTLFSWFQLLSLSCYMLFMLCPLSGAGDSPMLPLQGWCQ